SHQRDRKQNQNKMSYSYFVYLLIAIFLYRLLSPYFLISSGFRKIPSLPLITNVKWNIELYLLGVPLATNIRKFLLEPIEETGIVRYYDILWKRWIIFVSRPHFLKEINTKTDTFQKIDAANRPMSRCEYAYIGRKNILFENKEEHLRHRRVANPSFHHIWPTELFGNIIKELIKELDKDLKVNDTINAQVMTQAFTLEALGKAAFGYNFG
ncbi:2636_t:CDS:2, partial [Acaulospora morrowiae]